MKKLTFVLLFLSIAIQSYAQRKISLPFSSSYNEEALVLLGIQYNYVNQSYQLQLRKDWQTDFALDYPDGHIANLGELKSIQSKPSTGFSVGIPVDLRVDDNLYFTFNPSFLFLNNLGVDYTSMNSELEESTITRRHRHVIGSNDGSNYNAFEFPLSVKFRSDEKILKNKFNRYRAYLIAGARYSRWVGISGEYEARAKETTDIPHALIMKPGYFSWEAGLGLDIFFPFFKMSPELKFNQSINNVFDNGHILAKDNKFMAPIEKGLIRNIYLSIIFQ